MDVGSYLFCIGLDPGRVGTGPLVHRFSLGRGRLCPTAGPLANYAPWLGVYGVGAVAAWAAFMLPGLVLISQGRLRRAAALVAVALILPLGARWAMPSFTHSSGALDVALLQGNIPQDEKFQSGSGVPQ